jgi:CheY-like chemotaxis protein
MSIKKPLGSSLPQILRFNKPPTGQAEPPAKLGDTYQMTEVNTLQEAVQLLNAGDPVLGDYRGIVIEGANAANSESVRPELKELLQSALILRGMPDGAALVDHENVIVQANCRLETWLGGTNPVGLNFYQAFGNPAIIGADASPLNTARVRKRNSTAMILVGERYFQLNVAPIIDQDGDVPFLVITLRDSTEFILQRQKLDALHQAGMALSDLQPEEIFEMDVDERINLLKDNILHYTKDLLNYNVVEIRLIDEETNRLERLLSVGIDSERAGQPLYVSPQDNGVTGFVAATGKSYLCEDTASDPLYLDGLIGARSSLTVPLIYHDKIIGTFNVESPDVRAFSESDLQFVETFARDIAQALNTLELLVAQRTNTAQESVEAIHSAVALPVDEILNDTVNVIENYIGHNPDVVKRLRSILKNVREIKQVIQNVGEKLAPAEAVPAGMQIDRRPALKDKNILVIDNDEQVRTSAHALLEKYGCVVETAHEGNEAVLMIRNADRDYDAIIADIRLPDMNGYDLLLKLKEVTQAVEPNLILMTGFGYDPGHSIVKARKAGLRPGAVLYKPFRLDQLLTAVETMVSPSATCPNG